MFEFAQSIDRLLQIAAPYLIAIAVILWVVAFGTAAASAWRRPLAAQPLVSPLFRRSATGFLIIVLSLCGAAFFLTRAAIDEVRARLTGAVTEIRVDGGPAPDPDRLLIALRQIQSHNYHHSHPTTGYRVRLQTAQGPLELLLRRDSTLPNEYSVFYPGFDEGNDIGTVITDALD
jgi:hypothetical protein